MNRKDGKEKFKKDRKSDRLNLRISPEDMAELATFSFEDGKPLSQIARAAIKSYINLRKNKA